MKLHDANAAKCKRNNGSNKIVSFCGCVQNVSAAVYQFSFAFVSTTVCVDAVAQNFAAVSVVIVVIVIIMY